MDIRETPKKVDEDWKAQVEAEKARERPKAQADARRAAPAPPGVPAAADFAGLVGHLAMQALVLLQGVPERDGGEPVRRTDEAQHVINLLEVLQDKTKGNLTEDERRLLDDTLYDLRMAFVQAAKGTA